MPSAAVPGVSCHTLGDAFRRCARRFPVTLGFAFALTAYLCFQVATEGEAGEKKLLMTIGYFLSVGTLLSLSLHLWAEEVKRRKLRLGVQIIAPPLCCWPWTPFSSTITSKGHGR